MKLISIIFIIISNFIFSLYCKSKSQTLEQLDYKELYIEHKKNYLKKLENMDKRLSIYENLIRKISNGEKFPRFTQTDLEKNNENQYIVQKLLGPLGIPCSSEAECNKKLEDFFLVFQKSLEGNNGIDGKVGIKGIKGENGQKAK